MSKTISAEDLLAEEAPEREFLLKPFFFHGSLSMIFAYPGIGKSWFVMWLAAALACKGKFFRWTSNKNAKILYIDSEMGKDQIRPRLAQIVGFSEFEIDQGQIEFVTPDLFKTNQVPNIAHPNAQLEYEQVLKDKDVLIIDNLGSASSPLHPRDTDEQTWMKNIQPWFLKLRAMGKCVILVHHAGKSGEQLGTSRREQPLDLIIRLSRPNHYDPSQGCQFQITFPKARHVFGDDLEPLFVKLIQREEYMNWDWKLLSTMFSEQIDRYLNAGMSEREICEEIPRDKLWIKSKINEIKRKKKEMYGTEEDDDFEASPF